MSAGPPVERSATILDTEMLDRLPNDPAWGHGRVAGSGEVMLHYIRLGVDDPVSLLHGWPGFWYGTHLPRRSFPDATSAIRLCGASRSQTLSCPKLPP